jgi:LuxR family maltose regulon positive regulatory protein
MATTMAPVEHPLGPVTAGPPARREPTFRDGFVPRPRLVRILLDAAVPLVTVVAPPGYGKTTLLAEWAEHEERPFAWVTAEEERKDAESFLAEVERALAEVPGDAPFVLVLDDMHLLPEPAARQLLAGIARRMPAGCRLAVASRVEPPLPLGRLRAHRTVVEVRARDLAMTAAEAHGLLTMAGVDVAQAETEGLLRRTEGWPAGLYLAALSLRDQDDTARAVEQFGGGDSALRDYFRDELLGRLSPSAVAFLRRASVLDPLSGPLCDAVLDRRGSAALLADLARRGAMLVPLDRREESFRLHGLLREALRAELRRSEPGREAQLHGRASAWYEACGEKDEAIEHAIAAGDTGRAGTLVWASVTRCVTKGRNEAVRRWLGAFTEEQIAAEPGLALAAAHSHLAGGRLEAALRYESVARRAVKEGPRTPAFKPALGLLRAALGADRIAAMGKDAARAYDLEPEDSPWRASCCLLSGLARHLTGDRADAEDLLEEAVRRAAVAAPAVQTLALAQLALLAGEREDWDSAAVHAMRACAQMDAYGLEAYPTSALVYAVSSFVRARRGRIDEAQADFARATRLLGELGDFLPWYEVEARLTLGRAALRLNDIAGARELLADASRLTRRTPDAKVLHDWADELEAALVSASATSVPESLTAAELRVLALLPTHLSFREIASRLYVTANTVKTQAHAVYRKFDASSRSEAVSRAIELGLLE